MEFDQAAKIWKVKRTADGQVANPRFKFEADVDIAEGMVGKPTGKLTVVFAKNDNGKPEPLTAFPGDNAPPLPARLEKYGIASHMPGSPESDFWKDHVFLQEATLTVAGMTLRPLTPEETAKMIAGKFTPSPLHGFVHPCRSPQEVLNQRDIRLALSLLSSVTRNMKQVSARVRKNK